MNRIFICPNCGKITLADKSINDKILKRNYQCSHCENSILMKHSYPPLHAQDLIFSVSELFKKCKEIDDNNLSQLYDYMISQNFILDKSVLKANIDRLLDDAHERTERNASRQNSIVSRNALPDISGIYSCNPLISLNDSL